MRRPCIAASSSSLPGARESLSLRALNKEKAASASGDDPSQTTTRAARLYISPIMGHLDAFFSVIGLVDADGVDPKQLGPCPGCSVVEDFIRRLGNGKPFSAGHDALGGFRGPPCV